VALATATSIFAGTPLLIRPATVAFTPVAVRRRTGITLAAVLAGAPVAPGAPVASRTLLVRHVPY